MKRECGVHPEKVFCSITEYKKLGKVLTDVSIFNLRSLRRCWRRMATSLRRTICAWFWFPTRETTKTTTSSVPMTSSNSRSSTTLCPWPRQMSPWSLRKTSFHTSLTALFSMSWWRSTNSRYLNYTRSKSLSATWAPTLKSVLRTTIKRSSSNFTTVRMNCSSLPQAPNRTTMGFRIPSSLGTNAFC